MSQTFATVQYSLANTKNREILHFTDFCISTFLNRLKKNFSWSLTFSNGQINYFLCLRVKLFFCVCLSNYYYFFCVSLWRKMVCSSLSYFVFALPSAVFGWTSKSFFFTFHHSLPKNCVTRIGLFHWMHWQVFLSVFFFL